MLSASDILKILESVPWWKQITGLPKKVAELEARIAALEGRPKAPGGEPTTCPRCQTAMTFVSERDDPLFEFAGVKRRLFRCETCGRESDLQWSAKNGYGM